MQKNAAKVGVSVAQLDSDSEIAFADVQESKKSRKLFIQNIETRQAERALRGARCQTGRKESACTPKAVSSVGLLGSDQEWASWWGASGLR